MLLGFMPGKEAMKATFIVRKMQEKYQKKEKKLYICCVDIEKAFDRVSRKVMEWAVRKKSILNRVMWRDGVRELQKQWVGSGQLHEDNTGQKLNYYHLLLL